MNRKRGFGIAVRRGLALVAACIEGCGGDATGEEVRAPSDVEPVFNAAVDAVMFYDDWESYPTSASLFDGSGDYRYSTNSPAGISILTTQVFEGTRKVSFDYQAAGDINHILESGAIAKNTGGGPRVVVLSYAYRNVGTPYKGKEFVILVKGDGSQQLKLVSFMDFIAPSSLQGCFYDAPGNPRRPDIPPEGKSKAWNRDPVGHQYMGNAGYPDWYQYPPGGTSAGPINDGSWHRFSAMFTKERDSQPGTGRIEMWIDGIKVMAYIGDDPVRCEYGQVYTARGATTRLIEGFQFPTTTSGGAPWTGGATIEFDALRIWTPGS